MKSKKFVEEPLIEFYRAIADEDEESLRTIHIPHSSVFYAREAYYNHTGHWVSLQRMEEAMVAEGLIEE